MKLYYLNKYRMKLESATITIETPLYYFVKGELNSRQRHHKTSWDVDINPTELLNREIRKLKAERREIENKINILRKIRDEEWRRISDK